MPIGDNLVARFQAKATDSNPLESISGNTLTPLSASPTQTLVDVGSEKGWQLSGAANELLQANLSSTQVVPDSDGGYYWLAVRYVIVSSGTDNNGQLAEFRSSSTAGVLSYRKTGSTTLGIRLGSTNVNTSFPVSVLEQTPDLISPVIHTVFARIRSGTADSSDVVDLWFHKTGDATRTDSLPDQTISTNFSGFTADVIRLGHMDDYTVAHMDFIVGNEDVTDAEAASATDDLRSVFPVDDSGLSIVSQIPELTAIANSGLVYNLDQHFASLALPITYVVNGSGASVTGSDLIIAAATSGSVPSEIAGLTITATDNDSNQVTTDAFNVVWDMSEWGYKGSELLAGGADGNSILYEIANLPAQNDDYFKFISVTSAPSIGTVVETFDDGSFTFDGLSGGQSDSFTFDYTVNNVTSSDTVNIQNSSGVAISNTATASFSLNPFSLSSSAESSATAQNTATTSFSLSGFSIASTADSGGSKNTANASFSFSSFSFSATGISNINAEPEQFDTVEPIKSNFFKVKSLSTTFVRG